MDIIAPQRAPSHLCVFGRCVKAISPPKGLLLWGVTRRASPRTNDRRRRENRGRACSRMKTSLLKNSQVPESGLRRKYIVQYICLFSEDAWRDKWPTTKDAGFWNACADSVNKTCKSSRTGLSALIKAMLYAQKKEERKRCDLIYDSLHSLGPAI